MSSRKKQFEHIFHDLGEYMFSSESILKHTLNSKQEIVAATASVPKKEKDKKQIYKKENLFIPRRKDKLFWSFYILINGFDAYEFGRNDAFKTEKAFKIAAVEKLRDMKDDLKAAKLRRPEVEDELVNQQVITIKGLHALCMAYHASLTYVVGRKYYEWNCGDEYEGIFVAGDTGDTGIRYEMDQDFLTKVRTEYWKVDNYIKPMKAPASYAIKELQDITIRLGLSILEENGKKRNKKTLYEQILTRL
jgi:hypothetical protein